jgi:hypothetical protein
MAETVGRLDKGQTATRPAKAAETADPTDTADTADTDTADTDTAEAAEARGGVTESSELEGLEEFGLVPALTFKHATANLLELRHGGVVACHGMLELQLFYHQRLLWRPPANTQKVEQPVGILNTALILQHERTRRRRVDRLTTHNLRVIPS